MKTNLQVLSIGSADGCNTVRDTLLQRHKSHLYAMADHRDLYAIQTQVNFHLAIFHNTLSPKELRQGCGYVRQRWPGTGIIVVGNEAPGLPRNLYDMRIRHDSIHRSLVGVIERITNEPNKSDRHEGSFDKARQGTQNRVPSGSMLQSLHRSAMPMRSDGPAI